MYLGGVWADVPGAWFERLKSCASPGPLDRECASVEANSHSFQPLNQHPTSLHNGKFEIGDPSTLVVLLGLCVCEKN